MFAGIVLVFVGIMLALRQAGFIGWFSMGYVWPLLLVALGIRVILNPRRGNCSMRVV